MTQESTQTTSDIEIFAKKTFNPVYYKDVTL